MFLIGGCLSRGPVLGRIDTSIYIYIFILRKQDKILFIHRYRVQDTFFRVWGWVSTGGVSILAIRPLGKKAWNLL